MGNNYSPLIRVICILKHKLIRSFLVDGNKTQERKNGVKSEISTAVLLSLRTRMRSLLSLSFSLVFLDIVSDFACHCCTIANKFREDAIWSKP